jgi:hypothetical protein
MSPPCDGGFGPLTSGFDAVADHDGGPLVRQIEISDTPEPGTLERPNRSHIPDIGFGDHPRGARIRAGPAGQDRRGRAPSSSVRAEVLSAQVGRDSVARQ